MKTAILLAVALAATALAAAPASADNVIDCAVREGHPPGHCAEDCLPLERPLSNPNRPWNCHEHD